MLSAIHYKNLTETSAFKMLASLKTPGIKELINQNRIDTYKISTGGFLEYNYAAKQVDDTVIDVLSELTHEQQVIEKYKSILRGEVVNRTENRMVLHHLCRGQVLGDVHADNRNMGEFYKEQLQRVEAFAEKIHSGELRGSTGKKFDTVVQIGIGGSDLGPRAMYLALRDFMPRKMRAHFIANVDPDDPEEVMRHVNPETTLIIVVTKSGTTQETLTNRDYVLKSFTERAANFDPSKHMIAVTSETSPLASSSEYMDVFYIDDYIGGRYSGTSVVGGAVLTLVYGKYVFREILAGAHEVDVNSLHPDIRRNAALMDAMIGVYERNVLGYTCTAILPYSHALGRFPAHLQQLDMESNGKHVNRFGDPISYQTGPVIFGEAGTNCQHSFFQLMHQGTEIIPLQFIGFILPQTGKDIVYENTTSQIKLKANLAAQIIALAKGHYSDDGAKHFAGNRPSSLLLGKQLTPRTLGAILAHFENKIMFQGLIWNINSFDQEGVQLGKILTKRILNKEVEDKSLLHLSKVLGIPME